jgi:GTP-binding protein EngB required for normal cell division
MYPQNTGSGFTFIPKTAVANPDIEQYFLELAIKLKTFDVTINHNLPYLLHGYLNERIHMVQKLQLRVVYRYMNEIERFLKILIDVPNDSLNQKLRDEIQVELNKIMNHLTLDLQDLQAKARFINDLIRRKFRYYNVSKCNLEKIDSIAMLERTLIKDNRNDRILCSNDILNNNNQSKLKILLHQLAKELKTNPNLRLIYADFSYSSFELFDIMILPVRQHTNPHSLSLPSTENQIASPSSLPNNDVINILLLGESGVGKSTFINAFVNYLTFNTLKQAQSNKPIVLIPVSFLITTGDSFEERIIEFGDSDTFYNEDFDHPGQSVTQHCQSYVFNLDHNDGRKLRIIDTPGFGDKRGLEQDDLNMQHILQYINNLPHLNAVCFLLKPNQTRLNIFFQTCLTQLLDVLGPNVHQNIIFCFTNARSTFYTPGNTAPLLRTMLDSPSTKDIPFNKENTFCFDNESFRYLVALQNGIQFDDKEKHDYEMSWSTSVDESNRLLSYVRTQLNSYPLHHGWQSVRYAQIEIGQMVRPILEAMRNSLRNIILSKTNSSNRFIKLCPQVIQRPSAFCASCKRDSFPLGNFWILPDDVHEFRSKCLTCACLPNEHISVDYILGYDILDNPEQNKMNDLLNRLSLASIEFAHFLLNAARSTKEDPFLIGLIRIIREEKQICAEHQSNPLNLKLVEELEKYRATYEEQMKKMQLNEKHRNLQFIDEKIKEVCKYPMVREQMAAIHKKNAELEEFEITKNSIRRKTYLSTEC